MSIQSIATGVSKNNGAPFKRAFLFMSSLLMLENLFESTACVYNSVADRYVNSIFCF